MKKLIIVRHGDVDDSTGELDEFGQKKMPLLAALIAPHINGLTALLLTSPKIRATQSARLLNEVLNLHCEVHTELMSGGDFLDGAKALTFVHQYQKRADVLILVTHEEYGEYFPDYFGVHELKLVEGTFSNTGLLNGEAFVIDCETKKMLRESTGLDD